MSNVRSTVQGPPGFRIGSGEMNSVYLGLGSSSVFSLAMLRIVLLQKIRNFP